MSKVILVRRESFSASHRLYSADWSEAENEAVFGKCSRPNGHGHNYVLRVSLQGEVDPKSGILMNLTDLKKIITEHVLNKVDHRHLNLDVPEFKTLNPTTENVARVIWKWLQPHLGALLFEVQVNETENNSVIYRGE